MALSGTKVQHMQAKVCGHERTDHMTITEISCDTCLPAGQDARDVNVISNDSSRLLHQLEEHLQHRATPTTCDLGCHSNKGVAAPRIGDR